MLQDLWVFCYQSFTAVVLSSTSLSIFRINSIVKSFVRSWCNWTLTIVGRNSQQIFVLQYPLTHWCPRRCDVMKNKTCHYSPYVPSSLTPPAPPPSLLQHLETRSLTIINGSRYFYIISFFSHRIKDNVRIFFYWEKFCKSQLVT